MNEEGFRMIRSRALILAMTVAFASACAGMGGGETGQPESGNPPRDDSNTNAAGLALAQASTAEPEAAEGHFQTALNEALEGIEADSTNPKAYLIAAQAAIGLGNYVQADTMFERAVELYPGYRDRVVSEREQGWVTAYNEGARAMNQGELERALELFEGADRLYQGRPEARLALGSLYLRTGQTEEAANAFRNAYEILSEPPPEGMAEEQINRWKQDRQEAAFNGAQLLAQTGDFDAAAELMDEFLTTHGDSISADIRLQGRIALANFMAQAGQAQEAEALYDEILGREDLTSAEYFQAGIGFFNTGNFDRAAEAFATAAELNPYSRDALLNLVQSLYSRALELEEAMEDTTAADSVLAARQDTLLSLHDRILEAADQVREFDPLNRNLLSFMLRSLRAKAELADEAQAEEFNRRAQDLYRSYQAQPYGVSEVSFTISSQNQVQITGNLTNHSGTAGETVRLRFSLMSSDGEELNSEVIETTAPEQGASTGFRTTLDVPGGQFAGWQYELVD